jgi:hypothetical protein
MHHLELGSDTVPTSNGSTPLQVGSVEDNEDPWWLSRLANLNTATISLPCRLSARYCNEPLRWIIHYHGGGQLQLLVG